MSRARAERVVRLLRRAGRADPDARARLRRLWWHADSLDLDRQPRLHGPPPRRRGRGGEGGA